MPFIKIPALRIGRKSRWILDEELVYKSRLLDRNIVAPKGFETDLASIPWGLRNLFNINGDHRLAAIVHDYLYSKSGLISTNGLILQYTRGQADKVFLEAMDGLAVGWLTRKLMYRAVRVGGWLHWSE